MSDKFWENARLLDAVVAKQPVAKLIVQFLTPAEARRVQLETNLRRLVETANMRDGQERKRCAVPSAVFFFFCVVPALVVVACFVLVRSGRVVLWVMGDREACGVFRERAVLEDLASSCFFRHSPRGPIVLRRKARRGEENVL